jgi:hypothetical protein
MKIGSTNIINAKIGSTNIQKVFSGSDLVWSSVDPDAQAFITAAAITNPTQQSAVNQLVVDLKGYGVWSKMKALYPFVGGTASQHKFNLKNPLDTDAAFRLVFNGGWTHASTGATPNGTNGYANTFLVPLSDLNLNSLALGFYTGSNVLETSVEPVNMGSFFNTTVAFTLTKQNSALITRNNGNAVSYTSSVNKGFFVSSKQSATLTDIYVNGTQQGTGNSGGNRPNNSCYLGNMNFGGIPYAAGYAKNDFRLAFFSNGLTDTDAANLYTAVQTFQTALNRNV